MLREGFRQGWIRCALALVTCIAGADFVPTTVFATGQQSPGEVLRAFEKSLRDHAESSFVMEHRLYYNGPAFVNEALIEVGRYEARCDGQRWWVKKTGWAKDVYQGKVREIPVDYEFVLCDDGTKFVEGTGKDLRITATLSKDSDAALPGHLYLGPAALLFGHFPGDAPHSVLDIIQQADLSIGEEPIDGHSTVWLQGRGRYGVHRIWIDPAIGFKPRRVEVRKEGSDLLGSVAVSSVTGQGGLYPPLRLEKFVLVASAFQYQRVGKSHFVTSLTIAIEHAYRGAIVRMRHEIGFTDISVSPGVSNRDAFQISTSIPNGTPVTNLDAPTINYEWQNGQVAKSVNQEVVSKLEAHGFLAGVGGLRLWLFLMSALVLFAIVILFWKFRSVPRE